jgi:hypothetical protein
VKSEISTGIMELKAQGVKGRMTVYRKSPGLSYSVIEIDGVGKIEEASPMGSFGKNRHLPVPHQAGRRKGAICPGCGPRQGPALARLVSKAEVTGEETIDSIPHYRVVVTPKDGGRPETRFYDQKTGLLRRVT